jgi:Cu+-exporting ATPase
VTGSVDGVPVLVGSRRLLAEHGVAGLDSLTADADAIAADGGTSVWVAADGRVAGVLAITDPVKAESAEAVRDLRAAGLDVWLLTGDARATADAVARQVGIPADRVVAEVLPADKDAVVARLQGEGRRVAMVGDGINDAPALARADLGVAIGTGADVAIEASDITLVGGDPRLVASSIALSRATLRVVRQNLFWAFAYNVLLIPIAMGVLYPAFGILLSPALAAAAMALSSVSVVANSLRLRRVDVRPGRGEPLRRGRVAALRDAGFLVGIAVLGLATAGGVLAADRAIDANLPRIEAVAHNVAFEPDTWTVTAGRWTVMELRNEDPVVHDWMVEGVPNVEVITRPGETESVRFVLDRPGQYRVLCSVDGHAEAGMVGTLVVVAP